MDQLYSSKEKLIKKTIEQKKIIKRDLKNFEKLVLASEQNPKNLDILLELARTASQLNKTDIEISSLKKILSIKNSTKLKSLLAQAYIRKADGQVTSKAQKLINEALTEDPLDPGANFLNGLAQSQIGNEMLAFEIWTELYKRTGENDTWKKDLENNIRSAAKNLGISKKTLENKLKDNVLANNGLTKEILNLNEKEQNLRINQMVEQLADRLKDDKNDFEGWVRLYQSYKVLGSNEKALKALRDATKLNPKNINLKQMLLRELLPTNKKPVFSKETNKLVDDILVLDPNNVDGLFFSGFAAYNKGEKKKAITYWDLLLKQLPKDSLMSKEINKRIRLLQD
tara:strand:- start:380 stop:1402 length:1023 start_codon:yes stop_codon:yes gene_type:complete